MTHPTQHRRAFLWSATVALMATIASARPAAAVDPAAPVMPRVRSNSPAIATLIELARERSATFRALVATIDGTDGIVYVDEGKCGHSVRACFMLSVQVSGPHRVLRILVDSNRDRDGVMGAIGHELRHAIEVLSNPKMNSGVAVVNFYLREGATGSERFETPAAVRAGLSVYAEVVAAGRRK